MSLKLGGETQKKTLAFVKPPPPIYPILNALSEGTLCWCAIDQQLNLIVPRVPSHLSQQQVSESVWASLINKPWP